MPCTSTFVVVAIMADGKSGVSAEAEALSTASLWKGENDSDAEQMEAYDSNPLALVCRPSMWVYLSIYVSPVQKRGRVDRERGADDLPGETAHPPQPVHQSAGSTEALAGRETPSVLAGVGSRGRGPGRRQGTLYYNTRSQTA